MKYESSHKPRQRITGLEDLRRRAGWSQNEVARRSGLAVGTVCSMERPEETGYVAGIHAIETLAKLFGVHPATIARGQLGSFECECCNGRGRKLVVL